MGSGEKTARTPTGAEQRGLWKLMLRLPAVRGRLQIITASSNSLGNLFSAYDEATAMLSRLRTVRSSPDEDLIVEYETICEEIEAEVIQYCLHRSSGAS